jgi:hypothetical protein
MVYMWTSLHLCDTKTSTGKEGYAAENDLMGKRGEMRE